MKKIVHKSFLKKIFLTLIIVMGIGFVYAQRPTQVKIIKCYPNPASSVINFDFTINVDKTYSLQIYSFSGKKMTNLSAASSKVSVMLDNDFYRGIYIYQLRDKTGRIIETGKFQVVK